MSIGFVLGQLFSVEEAAYNRWRAACPVCRRKGTQLTIQVDSDGFIDIHCDRYCPNGYVLAAAGIPWPEMFPPGKVRHHAPEPEWWTKSRRYQKKPQPPTER